MQYLRVLKFSMYICTYTNYVIFMYNQQDFKYKAYIKNVSTIFWLDFCQHDINLDICEKG